MIKLGLNIDHVATIRNARGENHPYPHLFAKHAIHYGANYITIHLREDRRHINNKDLKNISLIKKIPLNLEIAATTKMLKIACKFKPNFDRQMLGKQETGKYYHNPRAFPTFSKRFPQTHTPKACGKNMETCCST